ncbi:hypothetical protein GJ744_005801 [Endocarpon pusillum]|uniref:Uncharacterized protein n=1 Tax=Endocarpon pusillum TaxID=364733 RepID=A0A8H7A4G0_9EURO|nr:hypothetical protein GJ744_005801 [Endocarpon pusillum]
MQVLWVLRWVHLAGQGALRDGNVGLRACHVLLNRNSTTKSRLSWKAKFSKAKKIDPAGLGSSTVKGEETQLE